MTVVSAGPQTMIETLREQLAPKASDAELQWLAAVSKRLDLDPIKGHVVLIGRWNESARRTIHRPQITAEGRLVLAERTGELDGFTGPEWCERARNADGSHTWLDVWDADEPPHAARCIVFRRGRPHPANGTVRWSEFAQYDSKGKLTPTWQKMPSHMLGKVALSLGLRRAFAGTIPSDVEIDDDLVPVERDEPTIDAGGEISSDADAVGSPPAPSLQRSGDDVLARIEALPQRQREQFRQLVDARRWPWPTTSSAVLTAAARELTQLEADAADERDTYGDDAEPDGRSTNPNPPDSDAPTVDAATGEIVSSDWDRYMERGGGLGT